MKYMLLPHRIPLALAAALALTTSLLGQDQIAQDNWPQFRGLQASGVAHAPKLPVEWDSACGQNIAWRTPIPGLGLSSPVIWGNKIFITTAVGEGHENETPGLRVGLYGDIEPADETFPHLFQVICLDKKSGKILWRKTAHKGVPQVKRHPKGSHASSTVAVDGRHVVAFFGSEGLYCYDLAGQLKWQKNLGFLNSAFFAQPTAQWGFGSSPVLHKGRVIVQCDVLDQSFVAALDADTGEEIWRTLRDEQPTWCTPTLVEVNGRDQVILNGWHRRAAYDFETGQEIWFMDGGGDIPTPTPIIAHDMAFFTSSHGRLRPIYAIRLEAQGDISLKPGETHNAGVVWSNPRRGAYMPTPLIVDDLLYVVNNSGILTVYQAQTGQEVYRQRLGGVRGAYTGSAVSNGQMLYFPSENGTVHVIQAGSTYKAIASNALGEPLLTSPAIAGDMLFIRTANALYGIKETGKKKSIQAEQTPGGNIQGDLPPMPVLPSAPLTDATEIFKVANTVAEAIQSVSYTLRYEGVGSLAERLPQGQAQVAESGWGEFTADRFRVQGEFTQPGAPTPRLIDAGCDGDKFYIVNDTAKTLHAEYEFGVMGRSGGLVYNSLVHEFVKGEAPFANEVAATNKTLNGVTPILDEPCYEIVIQFDNEQAQENTYWISIKDFTLRKRTILMNRRDGSRGGQSITLSDLILNPRFPQHSFDMPQKEGYQTVSTAPQQ